MEAYVVFIYLMLNCLFFSTSVDGQALFPVRTSNQVYCQECHDIFHHGCRHVKNTICPVGNDCMFHRHHNMRVESMCRKHHRCEDARHQSLTNPIEYVFCCRDFNCTLSALQFFFSGQVTSLHCSTCHDALTNHCQGDHTCHPDESCMIKHIDNRVETGCIGGNACRHEMDIAILHPEKLTICCDDLNCVHMVMSHAQNAVSSEQGTRLHCSTCHDALTNHCQGQHTCLPEERCMIKYIDNRVETGCIEKNGCQHEIDESIRRQQAAIHHPGEAVHHHPEKLTICCEHLNCVHMATAIAQNAAVSTTGTYTKPHTTPAPTTQTLPTATPTISTTPTTTSTTIPTTSTKTSTTTPTTSTRTSTTIPTTTQTTQSAIPTATILLSTTTTSSTATPTTPTATPTTPTATPSVATKTISATAPTTPTVTPTTSTVTPTTPSATLTTLTTTPTPTPQPTSIATTPKPSVPTSCVLCSGPPFICEQRFHTERCSNVDQQFCINEMTNNNDGTRTLDRKCATQAECEEKWWHDTSDRTECTLYDLNGAYAYSFKCSYCCGGHTCNAKTIPDNLYQGTGPKGRK